MKNSNSSVCSNEVLIKLAGADIDASQVSQEKVANETLIKLGTDCKKVFSKYDAIVYLVKNGKCCSEWQEAGLFSQVCDIVNSTNDQFSINELQNMIAEAEKIACRFTCGCGSVCSESYFS
jgi:hypothetical protein